LLATVNIVAQENVVALWRKATILEKPEQIVILSMHITADLDGCLQLKQSTVGEEDFAGTSAKSLELSFGHLNKLAWLGTFRLQALVNDAIDIEFLCFLHVCAESM